MADAGVPDEERDQGAQPRHRGSNQSEMRAYNERLVLSLVRRHGSLAKTEIARITGLSAQTVSVIMRSLEADQLLLRGEPIRGRVGQPSVPLSLNPDGAFFLGLKIGRRSLDLVVVNFVGSVLAIETQHHAYPMPERTLEFVKSTLDPLLKAARVPRNKVKGFGVATPYELWGWTDEFGAPKDQMEAWRHFDAKAELARILPWEVIVENDATAACGAELAFGPHEDKQDFIYLFVGTLVGGGVVLNGSVFSGRTGNAGGFGPMRIPGGARGADRLVDNASLFVLEKMISDAGGDPFAIYRSEATWDDYPGPVEDWLKITARGLAHAVVSSLAVIDFEAAVIDGSFPTGIRDRLVAAVSAEIETMDLQGVRKPVVQAGIWGELARAVGAAALPMTAEYAINQDILMRS